MDEHVLSFQSLLTVIVHGPSCDRVSGLRMEEVGYLVSLVRTSIAEVAAQFIVRANKSSGKEGVDLKNYKKRNVWFLS